MEEHSVTHAQHAVTIANAAVLGNGAAVPAFLALE
jgi:hypothetical protein